MSIVPKRHQRRKSALGGGNGVKVKALSLKTSSSFTGTMFNKAKFALPHTMKHAASFSSPKRRSRKTMFTRSRRKGIFAVRESISVKRRKRDKLLQQSRSIWERVRIRLLHSPSRLSSDLKDASIAIGVSLLKSSCAFRKMAVSIFKKTERVAWEKCVVKLVVEEIESINALKHFLTASAFDGLCDKLTVRVYMDNDIIYRQNEASMSKMIVLQGKVLLSTQKNLIRTLCQEQRTSISSQSRERKSTACSRPHTGWRSNGWESLIAAANSKVDRFCKVGGTFGSRTNGENLAVRSSTARAIKHDKIAYEESSTSRALIDVLVLPYSVVDRVTSNNRVQNDIENFVSKRKKEVVWEKLVYCILEKCKLFHKIHPSSLLNYVQNADVVTVPKGSALIEPGSASNALYLVLDGRLRLHDKFSKQSSMGTELSLTELVEGSVCGESFIIQQITGNATILQLQKRIHEISEFSSLSLIRDMCGLEIELYSVYAKTECRLLKLDVCPVIEVEKLASEFSHHIFHKDMICLILIQALKRNNFLQKRGCKATTEQTRVESSFFSPLSGGNFSKDHRSRIRHVSASSMKSLNKRLFVDKVTQAYKQDRHLSLAMLRTDTGFATKSCTKLTGTSNIENPFSQPLSSDTSSVDALYNKFMSCDYSTRNAIVEPSVSSTPVKSIDTSTPTANSPKKMTRPKSAMLAASSRHYNLEYGAADVFAHKRVRPASAYANIGQSTTMQRFKPKKRPASALNPRLQFSENNGRHRQSSRPASAIPRYPGYKYFH